MLCCCPVVNVLTILLRSGTGGLDGARPGGLGLAFVRQSSSWVCHLQTPSVHDTGLVPDVIVALCFIHFIPSDPKRAGASVHTQPWTDLALSHHLCH